MPDGDGFGEVEGTPVFIGHYWMDGPRMPKSSNRRQRQDIFAVEDEIEARRDALVAALQKAASPRRPQPEPIRCPVDGRLMF